MINILNCIIFPFIQTPYQLWAFIGGFLLLCIICYVGFLKMLPLTPVEDRILESGVSGFGTLLGKQDKAPIPSTYKESELKLFALFTPTIKKDIPFFEIKTRIENFLLSKKPNLGLIVYIWFYFSFVSIDSDISYYVHTILCQYFDSLPLRIRVIACSRITNELDTLFENVLLPIHFENMRDFPWMHPAPANSGDRVRAWEMDIKGPFYQLVQFLFRLVTGSYYSLSFPSIKAGANKILEQESFTSLTPLFVLQTENLKIKQKWIVGLITFIFAFLICAGFITGQSYLWGNLKNTK